MSVAPWAGSYVGIPYKFGVFDCWDLARLVQREVFGRELSGFAHEDADQMRLAQIVREAMPLANVEPVDAPEIGDIVLLRLLGVPCHIGVVVGEGKMLHALADHDSVIESYREPRWAKRLEGFYRVKQN